MHEHEKGEVNCCLWPKYIKLVKSYLDRV